MDDSTPNQGCAIQEDLFCIHCGYNLRGLQRDQKCPECGQAVPQSLRGNLLRFSDPDWLAKLRFGASLKLWSIAIALLMGFGAGVLGALGFGQTPILFASFLGGALGLWATFAITTQEPRNSLQEDPVTLRKVVRSCALGGMVGSLLSTMPSIGGILQLLAWGLSLLGTVAAIGELIYLRRFALRLPDEKLARSTKQLLWAYPIAMIGGIAVAVWSALKVSALTSTTSPSGVSPMTFSTVFLAFALFAGLLSLVCVVWYIILLRRYRKAFKNAIEEAKALVSTVGNEIAVMPTPASEA